MAQDHGLGRQKKESTNGPVHGPPLQARVAAANGAVLQLANMLLVVVWNKLLALTENKPPALTDGDPGAHGRNRWQAKHNGRGKAQSKLNGGKNW